MSVFERCIGRRNEFTITATKVYNYIKDPFTVWCDYFAPREEREPENQYLHLLFERGIRHEKLVVEKMGAERLEFKTFSEGFKRFLDGEYDSASNVPLFFHPENLFGICDVLKKDSSHASDLGDFHYTVVEIKNARHIRTEHILQAAFYNYLLGKVQGYTPEYFWLVNRDNDEMKFEYAKYHDKLLFVLDGIRRIQQGEEVKPTAKSAKWPWRSFALKKALEADDVSVVPMVGSVLKQKLNEKGVMTVKQLFETDLDFEVPEATWNKIKLHAKAYVLKQPQIIKVPDLPYSDVELFIDFEGTDELELEEGNVQVDYLIGVVVRDKSSAKYHKFVAHTLQDEEKMIKEFAEFLKDYEGAPIYHYGPYEKIHLNNIAQKYRVKFKLKLVDLLSVVRSCVAFPLVSRSLKDIAKYLGFEWRDSADAQESIVMYLDYLDSKDPAVLQRILDYNEDDCRATMLIKDYLEKIKK